jgi:UPF0716 protein FxsA
VIALLVFLFIAIPIAEIAVIIKVGSLLGYGETIALLLLVSVCGAWLVKRQGVGVLRRIREQMNLGRVPGTELVDGALILVAGVLLLAPGFITDTAGLLLLVPPVRSGIRRITRRRLGRRVTRRVRVVSVRSPGTAGSSERDQRRELPPWSG